MVALLQKRASRKYEQDADREARAARSWAHRQLVAQFLELRDGSLGERGRSLADRWIGRDGIFQDVDIRRCPGTSKRHDVCGELTWDAYSCWNPLCPHCASRESHRLTRQLEDIIERRGAQGALYLRTMTMPNVPAVTREVLVAFKKAVQSLHRTKECKWATRGGFYGIEATYNKRRNDWHPHAHEVVEGSYWPQWPVWDVRWNEDDRKWDVVRKWDGMAKLWSKFLHKRGFLPGYEAKRPETYAFVDIRKADADAVKEVAKYPTKAATEGGLPLERLVEFLEALGAGSDERTFRRRDLFGIWRKKDDDEGDEDDERDEEPAEEERPSVECACPWCADPNGGQWQFGQFGVVDGCELWWCPETGRYMVVEVERAERWRRGVELWEGVTSLCQI